MAPKVKCINCDANDWLKSEQIGYIPPAKNDGKTSRDGLHVEVWMCKACWILMPFGSNK